MNLQRYSRQVILKNFGEESQSRLLKSRILVAGAGGLGCPALMYLAAAGAGTICIADFDKVDLSNIQRQVLYKEADCGFAKATTAAGNLMLINSEINIEVFDRQITNENALELISRYDVIIDCTDNFPSRYLINDACCIADKPLVYGAVLGFEGQAGVFNLQDGTDEPRTNYRDLVPVPPEAGSVFSCSDAGVIGAMPGVIGSIQALEAIKIVTNIGKPLANRIISYNSFTGSFYEFTVTPNPAKPVMPADEEEFRNFDYAGICAPQYSSVKEIGAEEFIVETSTGGYEIIDVREDHEPLDMEEFGAVRIPLSSFSENSPAGYSGKRVIIFCEAGVRSRKAAELLRSSNPGVETYSLSGGAGALRNYLQTQNRK